MTDSEFYELLNRYEQGLCTAEEKQLLEKWLDSDTGAKAFKTELERKKILSNLRNSVFQRVGIPKKLQRERAIVPDEDSRPRGGFNLPAEVSKAGWAYRIAASLLLIAVVGYGAFKYLSPAEIISAPVAQDIKAGGDRAVLKLADGTQVELNGKGTTIPQQGVAQIVNISGKLSYQATSVTSEIIYNTVSTPRGGQYKLTLADGSNVWLNAASSLKFPAAFSGNERIVELTGEAYFEVAKNEKMPFRVIAPDGSEVKVLGTHFNVMAYSEENVIKTTLLEGSVKIIPALQRKDNGGVILSPNQQANILKSGTLSVIRDYDVSEAVAWKDGKFSFNETGIEEIMRQLARWYNVDVSFEDEQVRSLRFGVKISRKEHISSVLKLLEATGSVDFEIEGRKIIVKSVTAD